MSPTENLLLPTPTHLSSAQLPPPGPLVSGRRHRILVGVTAMALVAAWLVSGPLLGLGFAGVLLLGVLLLAAFQTLVRRRPWRALLVRDADSLAHSWVGKVVVAVVLVLVPAAMVLSSVVGHRYGRYADDSWKALLMLVVLAGTYLVSRRLLLTVFVASVTVGVASWVMSPNLATDRNGDATVLAHLTQQAGWAQPDRLPGRRGRRDRPPRLPRRCGWRESAPTTQP